MPDGTEIGEDKMTSSIFATCEGCSLHIEMIPFIAFCGESVRVDLVRDLYVDGWPTTASRRSSFRVNVEDNELRAKIAEWLKSEVMQSLSLKEECLEGIVNKIVEMIRKPPG